MIPRGVRPSLGALKPLNHEPVRLSLCLRPATQNFHTTVRCQDEGNGDSGSSSSKPTPRFTQIRKGLAGGMTRNPDQLSGASTPKVISPKLRITRTAVADRPSQGGGAPKIIAPRRINTDVREGALGKVISPARRTPQGAQLVRRRPGGPPGLQQRGPRAPQRGPGPQRPRRQRVDRGPRQRAVPEDEQEQYTDFSIMAKDPHAHESELRYRLEEYSKLNMGVPFEPSITKEELLGRGSSTLATKEGYQHLLEERMGFLADRKGEDWAGDMWLARRLVGGKFIKFVDEAERNRVITLAMSLVPEHKGEIVGKHKVDFVPIDGKLRDELIGNVMRGNYEVAKETVERTAKGPDGKPMVTVAKPVEEAGVGLNGSYVGRAQEKFVSKLRSLVPSSVVASGKVLQTPKKRPTA